MENELMPCPVCGGGVTQPGNSDVYCVDCNYKNHVGDHNTLARRAEIGRLVESLIPDNGRNLTIEQPDGQFGVFRTGKLGTGPTLLESLRALEKEVCGDT